MHVTFACLRMHFRPTAYFSLQCFNHLSLLPSYSGLCIGFCVRHTTLTLHVHGLVAHLQEFGFGLSVATTIDWSVPCHTCTKEKANAQHVIPIFLFFCTQATRGLIGQCEKSHCFDFSTSDPAEKERGPDFVLSICGSECKISRRRQKLQEGFIGISKCYFLTTLSQRYTSLSKKNLYHSLWCACPWYIRYK